MKKIIICLTFCLQLQQLYAQSVGIGTTNPNPSSSLDLGTSAKPLILPRLNTAQMIGVTAAAHGMVIYNDTEHQLYSFVKTGEVNNLTINQWRPIGNGPRMITWGIVDSFATELNGSGNYNVVWDATNNWYTLTTNHVPFYRDSMMLFVTPVGNGSWDQVVSIGELINGSDRKASIKFTDVSRKIAGLSALISRRRSSFYFTLYNLRKDPF